MRLGVGSGARDVSLGKDEGGFKLLGVPKHEPKHENWVENMPEVRRTGIRLAMVSYLTRVRL